MICISLHIYIYIYTNIHHKIPKSGCLQCRESNAASTNMSNPGWTPNHLCATLQHQNHWFNLVHSAQKLQPSKGTTPKICFFHQLSSFRCFIHFICWRYGEMPRAALLGSLQVTPRPAAAAANVTEQVSNATTLDMGWNNQVFYMAETTTAIGNRGKRHGVLPEKCAIGTTWT